MYCLGRRGLRVPVRVGRGSQRGLNSFSIVETTLREGEQLGSANFGQSDRIYIAKNLDRLGVEYIEVVNPVASAQAFDDASRLAGMGLKAKILAHTRCHMDDVTAAINAGVAGVSMYMATSAELAQHSHGVIGVQNIIDKAAPIIEKVKSAGLEVRFSCEDTFRSDPSDLLAIYKAINELGVNRVGLADTVGVATPLDVYNTVKLVKEVIDPEVGIEFHTHDDTGCAIANALLALEAGATHINTCLLGIGERNGITPLGGFLARLYTIDKNVVMSKYDLSQISHLEKYVAHVCDVDIPFNNYVTGKYAFTHKAGVHTKAIMNDPGSYEVINPSDFGVERHVQIAHRLTGWNALYNRAQKLSLDISEDQIKAATTMIKNLADERGVTMNHVDSILIKLATGPKSSSSVFMKWSDAQQSSSLPASVRKAAQEAAKAMEQFEAAQAIAAISSVKEGMVDTRPSIVVHLQGHLFDKAVLNRTMDVLVTREVEFSIKSIDVPAVNEGVTSAALRIWGKDDAELEEVKESLTELIESMSKIADTSILFSNTETPAADPVI